MDKYLDPVEDTTYEGAEVRLCKDGKYRWKYEVNMFTNPAILITVFKVFFFTIVGLYLVFGFFLYVIHADWQGLWWMTKGMLIALGGFAVLSVLGYEEAACLEVAHADGANLSGTIGLLHSPPRAKHVAIGLMDKQQVDVLRLQLAQALVDALGSLFLASI